jgi:hypothetical protein
LETARLVAAVAERLVLALPTPAELDQGAPVEIKLPAVFVEELEIAFDVNTSVAPHGYFCWHSESP